VNYAEIAGFGFPIISEDKVLGVIMTAQMREEWVWSSARGYHDPVVSGFAEFRATDLTTTRKEEFLFLRTRDFGQFLLIRDAEGTRKIAPIGNVSIRLLGFRSTEGRDGQFVDYSVAKGHLRAKMRARLGN
jgi:hypothetical protein